MEAAGKRWILHPSRKDVFTVWHLSDLHLGARACAEDTLRRDIAAIRDDPHAFWFGGGDMVDLISCNDKRFDPDAVAPWVSVKDLGKLAQVGTQRARDFLAPIADKGLGMIMGNHELSAQKHIEADLMGWLTTELGVPNLGYCAFVDLVFVRTSRAKAGPKLQFTVPPTKDGNGASRWQRRCFLHHGAGFATTPGGKLNRLSRFMDSFSADIYFCGHVHDQLARRQPLIGADATCTKLVSSDRVGVVSGSYLRTYAEGDGKGGIHPSYGEQRGYAPVNLGAAKVTIDPERRLVTAGV